MTPTKTNPQTKAEQAYQRMRRMIIGREIRAGERWSIREVARQLGMSVIPVSEAARKLESDGLIVTRDRSGIRVRKLTASERAGLNTVREALEVQAARIVAEKHADNPGRAKKLHALVKKLQESLLSGDPAQAALLDYELHMRLVRWAGCPLLTETYARIALLSKVSARGWKGTWKHQELTHPGSHTKWVEGVLSGDPPAAEDAIRRHIRAHTTPFPN